MTDMQAKFQDKLRKALGVDDIVIDWSSYHRTPPVYLRNYDPTVCTSFASMSSDTIGGGSILFYNSLRVLCRKKISLYVYQDWRNLLVHANNKHLVKCCDRDGHPVPGDNYKI